MLEEGRGEPVMKYQNTSQTWPSWGESWSESRLSLTFQLLFLHLGTQGWKGRAEHKGLKRRGKDKKRHGEIIVM